MVTVLALWDHFIPLCVFSLRRWRRQELSKKNLCVCILGALLNPAQILPLTTNFVKQKWSFYLFLLWMPPLFVHNVQLAWPHRPLIMVCWSLPLPGTSMKDDCTVSCHRWASCTAGHLNMTYTCSSSVWQFWTCLPHLLREYTKRIPESQDSYHVFLASFLLRCQLQGKTLGVKQLNKSW